MTPSVHIVTINWNGLQDTLECLASLRAQDYPSVKVHVVDNGSANDEATTIEREFPEASVLRLEKNAGFCAGGNTGIRAALDAGADYVLLLNNDTIVPPQLISQLVDGSSSVKNVGAVSPVILYHPDKDLVWYAGSVWESETAGFRHLFSGRSRKELTATEPYKSAYACGCCLLINASVLRNIGLMDERYFAYYDEADWCSRMQAGGLDCYVIPSAILYHKVSRSTASLISVYLRARNRLLWMNDHLSLRQRARSFSYLLKELVWNISNALGLRGKSRHLSRDESKAMLRAWRDYFFGKFGAWPKRIERLVANQRNAPAPPQIVERQQAGAKTPDENFDLP